MRIGWLLGALALLLPTTARAEAPSPPANEAKATDIPLPDAAQAELKANLKADDPGVRAAANLQKAFQAWQKEPGTDKLAIEANSREAATIAAAMKAAPRRGPKRTKALKQLNALVQKTKADLEIAPPEVQTSVRSTVTKASALVDEVSAEGASAPKSSPGDVTFTDGSNLRYGPTVSLLRFQTSRRKDEPGRLRDYTPALDLLPAQVGFQFIYRPSATPWQLRLPKHKTYQLLSAGGILLAHVDTNRAALGSLSLAATLGLFDDSIGLGVGFDLYRGIPVRGADGQAGSATAYTGLLAAALAREGELTPENAFVVVTLNLAWLTKTVAGEL
jgi:hypothetical protein